MSYFLCPHCGGRTDIFGHGGAAPEAARLGVPLLGAVPLHTAIRELSDAGTPVVASDPDGEHAGIYRSIAAATWDRVRETRRSGRPAAARASSSRRRHPPRLWGVGHAPARLKRLPFEWSGSGTRRPTRPRRIHFADLSVDKSARACLPPAGAFPRRPGSRARITTRRLCPTPLALRAHALQATNRSEAVPRFLRFEGAARHPNHSSGSRMTSERAVARPVDQSAYGCGAGAAPAPVPSGSVVDWYFRSSAVSARSGGGTATPAILSSLAAVWQAAMSLASASFPASATLRTNSFDMLFASVGTGALTLAFCGASSTLPPLAGAAFGSGASVAGPLCPVASCEDAPSLAGPAAADLVSVLPGATPSFAGSCFAAGAGGAGAGAAAGEPP